MGKNIKWEYVPLSCLGTVARGKSRHRPRNDAILYGGRYPFIQTSDIKHANFYVNSYSQTYNDVGLAQSKLWPKDTLCMTIAANIAETALLSFPACFPDSIVGFVADNKKSDVKFVKYALDYNKREFQKTAKGTAQDNLSLEKIDSLKIKAPNVETQSRLASVLSAYDDLIENNEKRIKVLEEMCQRLYTEWFVKFRFPGHENVRMVPVETGLKPVSTKDGKIPEGWEVKDVAFLLERIKRKEKLQAGEYQKSGVFPIVDQGKEFLAGYTDNRETVYDEDLIVFGDHTRCIKYCNFPFACGADGTQILKTNNFERMPQILLYFTVLNAGLQNYNYARHFKFLKSLKVLLPDAKTAKKFEAVVKPTYEQIKSFRLVNLEACKTRDLLIPQLVTGRRELK